MNHKKKIAWLLNLDEQPVSIVPSPHTGIGNQLKSRLSEAGYEIKTGVDASNLGEFSVLISGDIDRNRIEQMAAYPRERCFLIATEPPAVIPEFHLPITQARFGKIFTLLQKYVDNKNFFKIHHMIEQKNIVPKEEEIPFEQKKFCCMIQGNKYVHPDPGELYSERKNLILFFSYVMDPQSESFDVYGGGWDGLKSWKGIARTNKAILKYYKFTVCYENTCDQPGYITERIFHSLFSRNVPVYLGAPDITDYVPKECFIDARDFGGKGNIAHKKLWDFMQNMDKETYEKYIAAGQDYIKNNKKLALFSADTIVDTIMEQVFALPD